jgi:plastocyanin
MRYLTLVLLSLTVAIGAIAPATAAKTVGVSLKGLEFSKPKVTINRGDRVRWTWKDGTTPHDVTSKGTPRFRSSATKSSGSHLMTFKKAGTYRYVCTIHPNMRGRVVVR